MAMHLITYFEAIVERNENMPDMKHRQPISVSDLNEFKNNKQYSDDDWNYGNCATERAKALTHVPLCDITAQYARPVAVLPSFPSPVSN